MAARTMSDKAIIIKGPTPESKSYFTGLPSTLEELVQKAVKLFPLPPNHTGHLLLDNDAILMPDVLPFLKDREVLTFRWTANTPRSSLRQPLRSEEMARHTGSSGGSSSSHGDSVNGSGGSAGSRAARNVRWDSSVLSTTVQNKDRTVATTNGKTDTGTGGGAVTANPAAATARPYRYSAAGRAEHSRRVLSEQEQLRRADAKDYSVTEARRGQDMDCSSLLQGKDASDLTSASIGAASTAPAASADDHQDPNVNSSSPSVGASADVEMTTAQEQTTSYDEQQNSSPVASPTRNIRSAQKSNNGWMTPLGSDKSDADTHASSKGDKQHEESTIAAEEVNAIAQETCDVADQDEATPATSLTKASTKLGKDERTHSTYQRMSSVVEALRSHPSNHFFHGCGHTNNSDGSEWATYLQSAGRAYVDFDTIAAKLQSRQYGQEDPFVGFAADLTQMWSNTRAFYGPQSKEAQCADFLDKFSRMITVEWRKESDARGRLQNGEGDAKHTKEEAMTHAAKAMKAMAYGSSHNKAKAPSGMNKSELVRPVASRPDRRSDVFAAAQQHGKPREQSTSPRLTKAKAVVEPLAADKFGDLSFTPRTHAFLAGMFAKKPSTAQPTSATSDMMAKLQQQFGPIPSAKGRPVIVRRESSTQKTRGIKRPASLATDAAEVSRKRVQVQAPADHVVSAATEAEPVAVPVVTVTEEDVQRPSIVETEPASVKGREVVVDDRVVEGVSAGETASETPAGSTESVPAVDRSAEPTVFSISPRRSGRQSAPSTRALQSQGQSPASTKRRSPLASSPSAKVAAAERGEAPAEEPVTTPQRMLTRRLAAAAVTSSGGVRTRRTATAV